MFFPFICVLFKDMDVEVADRYYGSLKKVV